MNLSLEDDSGSNHAKTSLKEKCNICDKTFPIDILREHFSSCSDFATKSGSESTEDEQEEKSRTENKDDDTTTETPLNGSDSGTTVNPVTVDLTADEMNAESGQEPDDVSEASLEGAIKNI
jgi:hypothetical protein